MRAAAEILLIEADALRPILETAPPDAFGRPTVCAGWSVRDVLAHCGAALTACATGRFHSFSPEDNQRDVDERSEWPLERVLDELFTGYVTAATAIDGAAGALDGIGLGEWVHGGDVREPLGAPDAYRSAGIDLAIPQLVERSRRMGRPALMLQVGSDVHRFGGDQETGSRLVTDEETFVRLTGGRNPDHDRYRLDGEYDIAEMVLFA